MIKYLIRRIATVIPVMWAVATIVFFLIHVIPGDPVDLIIGEQALPADRQELEESLNLNKPVLEQYGIFISGLLKGDWGKSIYDQRPVLQHLKERYLATTILAACAMLIAIGIALPLGIIAAVKRRTLFDSSAMFLALVGISVPSFWLGPVLVLIFSVKLGILPIAGDNNFVSLVLPSITLGAALAAMLSRMTRAAMIEELHRDYVTAARAKGLPEWRVVFGHAFKNALNPIVTIVGLQVGTLMAGTIITEKIFSWPGIGTLLLQSIGRRDYPVVEGCILVISFAFVIINTLTDCFYKSIDPRVRL